MRISAAGVDDFKRHQGGSGWERRMYQGRPPDHYTITISIGPLAGNKIEWLVIRSSLSRSDPLAEGT